MISPDQALLDAASGRFEYTLIAVLIIVIIGAFILLLKQTLSIPSIIKESNKELCTAVTTELRSMVDALKENGAVFKEHDKQARDGFSCVNTELAKIDTTLSNRPCIASGK